MPTTIRPIVPGDTPALLRLSGSLGFGPAELEILQQTFDDYHARNVDKDYQALAGDDAGQLIAVAYFVPVEMTDRTWELVMIVVDNQRQGQGIGSRLLVAAEGAIRAKNGRLLVIETSSSPDQDRARQFYTKHGYAEVARIPDAFADGEHKVIFSKRL